MSILSDSLLAKNIHLSLKASGHRDAFEELLFPLRGDKRVKDWEKLRSGLAASLPGEGNPLAPCPILLHHSRSESVSDLVIAAGRSKDGITLPGQAERIGLVFVAAIPSALNNEYLRILGAISRVCREKSAMRALMEATDPDSFLGILEKECRQ